MIYKQPSLVTLGDPFLWDLNVYKLKFFSPVNLSWVPYLHSHWESSSRHWGYWHSSLTSFSVKTIIHIISRFPFFKRKTIDHTTSQVESLCFPQNKIQARQYDVQDFSNSGSTLYHLLPLPSILLPHWTSKCAANMPSSCNVQVFTHPERFFSYMILSPSFPLKFSSSTNISSSLSWLP